MGASRAALPARSLFDRCSERTCHRTPDVSNVQRATLGEAKRTKPCVRLVLQSRLFDASPSSLPRWYDATTMELQERTDMLISLTPAAADKIRTLMSEDPEVSVLPVAVEGGRCSGFQYCLGFDRGAH